MLRITRHEDQDAVTLILEGRLGGPWVDEVRHAWAGAVERNTGKRLIVDLSGVTFFEEEGKTLLGQIYEHGGELRAADVMTKAVVEEVRQGKRSPISTCGRVSADQAADTHGEGLSTHGGNTPWAD